MRYLLPLVFALALTGCVTVDQGAPAGQIGFNLGGTRVDIGFGPPPPAERQRRPKRK